MVMVNQITLVGKISEMPVVRETSGGTKVSTLKLEIERGFKNSEGIFESDIMNITLWKGIASSTVHLANVGDLVAVKGRIQSSPYEGKDGIEYYNYELIAEKVTFLTGGNGKEEESE